MFLDKDSLILGLILGLVIPFIGLAIWQMIFEQISNLGITASHGFSTNWRDRTTALLAICMNLIPFTIYNRKRYFNSMRGLVFPTVLYCIFWFVLYGRHLIGL